MQSLEALKTQRESLMTAERRRQGAKQRTKELLNNIINGWETLLLDEHRKCMQFDRGRMNLKTLIILAEEAITAEPMEATAKGAHTYKTSPVESAASGMKEEGHPDEAITEMAVPAVKEEDVNTDDLRELAERRKTRTGMEEKTQEVDRIAGPKDEMRTT